MRCSWCAEWCSVAEAKSVRRNGRNTLWRSQDGRLHSFSSARKEQQDNEEMEESRQESASDGFGKAVEFEEETEAQHGAGISEYAEGE